MKITTKTILKKKGVEKISMLTAYDALFAKFADQAGVDMILVGDSVGNNMLGFSSTVPVTLDMMLHHTAAVSRANTDALVVADMPFALAHKHFDALLDASIKLFQQGGAQAVKIEGGSQIAEKIEKLVNAGIAVMGHIGLQPQQFIRLGGYRKFGKTPEEREEIIADARAIENSGAFSLVLEMCDADTAKAVSEAVSIPVIGIGSGADCDGQVLVFTDLLGLNEGAPSFAKRYANLREDIVDAYKTYIDEIKSGTYPERK